VIQFLKAVFLSFFFGVYYVVDLPEGVGSCKLHDRCFLVYQGKNFLPVTCVLVGAPMVGFL
jgi:hypothetical protein